MKAETVEILWHNREAVYAVDMNHLNIVATAGADTKVMVWHLRGAKIDFLAELAGHEKTVNVVRFSPDGLKLASAGDDGTILVWSQRQPDIWTEWSPCLRLRGHVLDVCDLCWSPDGTGLLSGSVDNTVILWDTKTGSRSELKRHENYVQGLAWDPTGGFMASQSSDQSCCVFQKRSQGKWSQTASISRVSEALDQPPRELFCDQDMPLFFRRLCFSPEGSLLFCPAGVSRDFTVLPDLWANNPDSTPLYTAYIFDTDDLSRPVLELTGFNKPVTAIRCCPVLFKCIESTVPPVFDLPYRIVFAVVSLDGVHVYDTQHAHPITYIGGLHYAHLTDVAWAADGSSLMVSSSDGYCSVISFCEGELGEILSESLVPQIMNNSHSVKLTTAESAPELVTAPKRAGMGQVNMLQPKKKPKSLPASESAVVQPSVASAAKKKIAPERIPLVVNTPLVKKKHSIERANQQESTPQASNAGAGCGDTVKKFDRTHEPASGTDVDLTREDSVCKESTVTTGTSAGC